MSTYTINISLPKQLAQAAQQQVKKGYYGSLSEVIRDALRQLMYQKDIPTYKMSKKAQRVAEQAWKEYKSGKLKPITSIKELL